LLNRLLEILKETSCPPGDYLLLQTEAAGYLIRISEGEPGGDALVPASDWMFRLPEPV
jgi:hypothetical protein